jgi:hypothetical protein
VDAERPDFQAQRLAVTLQRVLAGGIRPEKRRPGHQPGSRTDVDDAPFKPLAHVRQDGIGHLHHAEEVGFKHGASCSSDISSTRPPAPPARRC